MNEQKKTRYDIQKHSKLSMLNFSKGSRVPMKYSDGEIQRDFEVQVELHKIFYGDERHLFSMMVWPERDKDGNVLYLRSIARDRDHQLDDPTYEIDRAAQANANFHHGATTAMAGKEEMTNDEVRLAALNGWNNIGIDKSEMFGMAR